MANKRNKSKSSAQQDARSSQALANMRPLFTQFDFKPEHFFHRDLSLLQFFNRVLSMVDHPQTPLLERLRFLAICSTIADEFFEIRVAGIKRYQFGIADNRPDELGQVEVLIALIYGDCSAHRPVCTA